MKKLFLIVTALFSVAVAYSFTPTGYVQINPPISPQSGGFNTSSGTVGTFTATTINAAAITDSGLPPNQCIQTGSGGLLTGTGSACGSGGGGAGGGNVNTASQYSAPYYSVTGSSNVLSGLAAGTSGQTLTTGGSGSAPYWSSVTLVPGSTSYIQNSITLQPNSTFYVTSGTIAGNLNATKVNASTFQVNGIDFLSDGSDASSLFLGDTAAPTTHAGINNICVGQQTCNTFTATNSDNVIMGNRAGRNFLGATQNVCMGSQACGGTDNFGNGTRNTGIGANALSAISSGTQNTATGWAAGSAISTGQDNALFGVNAGNQLTTASGNVVMGDSSLGLSTTGSNYNVCLGFNNCLWTIGSSNTVVGATSGGGVNNSSTGNSANTYVGYNAGSNVDFNAAPLTKSICIGFNCVVTSSFTAQIGGSGVDAVLVKMSTMSVSSASVTGPLYTNVASGQCVQTGAGGQLTGTGSACGAGGGGSGIVNPGTFTWTNNFGMSLSTLTVSTVTLTGDMLGNSGALLLLHNVNNLFLGDNAGNLSLFGGGTNNAVVGADSMFAPTSGGNNAVLGFTSLNGFGSSDRNVAIGTFVLNGNAVADEVGVGYAALNTVTGPGNVGIGSNAGLVLVNSSSNVLVGYKTAYAQGSNVSATNLNGDVIIGWGAGVSTTTTITNSIAIGYGASVSSSNVAQIGGAANSTTAVNMTVSSVTTSFAQVVGPGNGNIQLTISGSTYSVTSSSSTGPGITVGHLAVFSSTNATLVDGGSSGGTPGGSTMQIQYNNGGSFGGAKSAVTASSTTIISSFSVTSNGSQNTLTAPGLVDIYQSAPNAGQILLNIGSSAQNDQVQVIDQAHLNCQRYGVLAGGLEAGSLVSQAIESNQSQQQFINYWNAGEMDLQTATAANGGGNIVLKPGTSSEVIISTLAINISTSTVITSTGTGIPLQVIPQGLVSGGYQNRKGIVTIGDDVATRPYSTGLVIVDSTTASQNGGALIEVWSDSPNHNDPKLYFHVVGHDSSPEIRDDAGAPNWEMINTSTDNAHGMGKWEPAALAFQSTDLQVNSRAYDNSTFENIAYWEMLQKDKDNGPGLYMQTQSLTNDSSIMTTTATAGINFYTLNSHIIGLTAPANVVSGSWRFALPSTANNLGQVLYQSSNGSSKFNDRQWDFTTGGATGNLLSFTGSAPVWVSTISIVAPITGTYEATFSTTSTLFHVAISTSGHFITNGATITVASCGANPTVIGDDNQGTITVGTGVTTACTLNFHSTWGAVPTCQVSDNSTAITADVSAISATAVTFSFSASVASSPIYYRCGCSGSNCL